MTTLRITQSTTGEDCYRVVLRLEGERQAPLEATADFRFRMTEQDQEDLRWYLEDYLQFPFDPAPTVAARVETRMAEIGRELFQSVFHSSDDCRDLWAELRPKLDDTKVEIVTSVQEATSIPWELTRDPKTDVPLALRASAFVRAQPQAAQRPELAQTDSGPIRILLVICRPSGDEDVPFRSVASQLIKGLGVQAPEAFQLDVLRPPTFDRLSRVLRKAKADGRPYHVVHFDGHGMYAELADTGKAAQWLKRLIPVVLYGPRTGKHGFLLFEKPGHKENMELVDGPTVGKLLVEADVPILVLNACRSAFAEAPTQPEQAEAASADDPHAKVRALGSLAQEVMDAGALGVVAMRYSVYVVTAAQFVLDLYATLVQGQTLGEAVTLGRKQLAADPQRTIAYDPRPLEDWCVPVVYEACPTALFPRAEGEKRLEVKVRAGGASAERGSLDDRLPKPPDVGFFGRDETLLAVDRALDTQSVVLLHAYAGSGKTATAAEFARWYSLTGGLGEGPQAVLFTSFEHYTPLARVLDRIGQVFGPVLEQSGVHWLALDDAARRDVALQVLRQVPVLWIWDNVEPVAGFPKGTPSAWSPEEQQELVDFLRDAQGTKAKFLLTSRRDERDWLGETLPRRIPVPPMPMQERVQLARALAERHGRRLTDVDDWRPLLRFTGGNPLTITVLVGQALRDGLKTRDQIEAFVSALRSGEARFDDEASEGRQKSLGASLSYGFEHAFNEEERRQLALLHFFQGFVDVDALKWMGNPEADWCVPAVRGLTREAGIALLDRAAEVGLLEARGRGYYTIHPALPWFFRGLFNQYYPAPESPDLQSSISNLQSSIPNLQSLAFVEAIGELGDYYFDQYRAGNRDVISALSAEEANLLHARRLARTHGWWHRITSTMQGLRVLYGHTGRRAEWRRLVDQIVPDFVDAATDAPLPGRQDQWGLVTEYRVRLAQEARQWAEAERLQRVLIDWARNRAAAVLEQKPEGLDDPGRNAIRTLAVSLEGLGNIRREVQQPECVEAYEDALPLFERIGDRAAAAVCAFNLGHAHKDIPAIRDLGQTEKWYRRGLELTEERDRLNRARFVGQLGSVAFQRFKEAREAGRPNEEVLGHVNAALKAYHDALDLLPEDAVNDLAVTHNQLGMIYGGADDMDRALPHYRHAIRYSEGAGNVYEAAQARGNVAVALLQSGRLADAREYALAALRNFQTFGQAAADDIQETQQLIEEIEKDLAAEP